MLRLRKALRGAIHGVLGNHGTILMVPDLERMGVRMPMNEHVPIERDCSRIFLAGVDDAHFFRMHDIETAAAGIDHDGFAILLSHAPVPYRKAAQAVFDILLAGHTHGGQICLPGGTPVILKASSPRRLARGPWAYRGIAGYTSVGVGACGVPVRFNCPPKITLHHLTRVVEHGPPASRAVR